VGGIRRRGYKWWRLPELAIIGHFFRLTRHR
jgi:hypothetical protein